MKHRNIDDGTIFQLSHFSSVTDREYEMKFLINMKENTAALFLPTVFASVGMLPTGNFFTIGNLAGVDAAQYEKNAVKNFIPSNDSVHSDMIPRGVLRSRSLAKPPNSKYLDFLETMSRPESNGAGASMEQNYMSFDGSTKVQPCPDTYDETESSYSEGDRVEIDGMIFECKGQAFTKYCGQAEFQGITEEDDEIEREYWFHAWRYIGVCGIESSQSLMQSSIPVCPPGYDASDTSYSEGDAVEVDGFIYECRSHPYSEYCGQSKFTPTSEEINELEMDYWLNAWKRVGPCILSPNSTETLSDIISGDTIPIQPTQIESETSSELNQSSIPECPPPYNSTKISYVEGDWVEIEGYLYECREYPYSLYCGQSEFQSVTKESDEIENEYWFNAWKRIGPCLLYDVIMEGQLDGNSDNSDINSSSESLQLHANQPSNEPSGSQSNHKIAPSSEPSLMLTRSPSRSPTKIPSSSPSLSPTNVPTRKPTSEPTKQSSFLPSFTISMFPSISSSTVPSDEHSGSPSSRPSTITSLFLTTNPTPKPSREPSLLPTIDPSLPLRLQSPSSSPTDPRTKTPTRLSTNPPSIFASVAPSISCAARRFHPNDDFSICTNGLDVPAYWMKPAVEKQYFYDSLEDCCFSIFKMSACPNGYVDECEPTWNSNLEEHSAFFISQNPTNTPISRPPVASTLGPTRGPTSSPTSTSTMISYSPSAQSPGRPSKNQIISPSADPIMNPTDNPSTMHSSNASSQLSITATTHPTWGPTGRSTLRETGRPTAISSLTSGAPTKMNSYEPSHKLSTTPSFSPSTIPFQKGSTQPTDETTTEPSLYPSQAVTLETSDAADFPSTTRSPTNIASHVELSFTNHSGQSILTFSPSPPPSFYPIRVPLPVIGVTLKTSEEGALDVDGVAQIFSEFISEQLHLELPKKYYLQSVIATFGLYSTSPLGDSKRKFEFIVNADAIYAENTIPSSEEIDTIIPQILSDGYLYELLNLFLTAQDPVARSTYDVDAYLLQQIESQNPAQNSQHSPETESSSDPEPILVLPVVVGVIVAILFMTLARYHMIQRGANLRENREIEEEKVNNQKKASEDGNKEYSKGPREGDRRDESIRCIKQDNEGQHLNEDICDTANKNIDEKPCTTSKRKRKKSEFRGKEIVVSPGNSVDGSIVTIEPFDKSTALGCLCV